MSGQYIFAPDAVRNAVETGEAIQSLMARYYEGVEKAKLELLDDVFHPAWLMKDTDTPDAARLNVEGKAAFIERVRAHGPYPGYSEGRTIVSVGIAHDQLAFVRVDKNASHSATDFFLFRIDGRWTIMDKLWVNPREVRLAPGTQPSSLQAVDQLLAEYQQALADADPGPLHRLLHEEWDLKFLKQDDGLAVVTRQEFSERVAAGDERGYLDHRQLLSVDTHQDSMAVVRIDLPARAETRWLVMLRVEQGWRIVVERRSRRAP